MSEAEPASGPQNGCNETDTMIKVKNTSHYKNTRHNPSDLCSLSFQQQPATRTCPKPGNVVHVLTHKS